MAGARIIYRLDGDKEIQKAIAGIGGILSTGTLRAIGVAMVESTQHRFDTATDPDGLAWKQLNPAYAMIKRGPGILRGSKSILRDSLTFGVRGTQISVGSNRIYAAIHQFGGKIEAKTPKGLVFNLGEVKQRTSKKGKPLKPGVGKLLVHVRSVNIPARPYLGFGPKDQVLVMDVLNVAWKRATGS